MKIDVSTYNFSKLISAEDVTLPDCIARASKRNFLPKTLRGKVQSQHKVEENTHMEHLDTEV